MRRLILQAALIASISGTGLVPARAQQSVAATPNSTPLAFGMDAEQASAALGTTLRYVSGRPGNEMFLALPNVKGSALADRRDGLYLQFRRGRLEGWKGDWVTDRPCANELLFAFPHCS